jgi:predicted GIY-YIG superfamily endonuclease
MASGYIYILGSHAGALYIGVTSNLYLRVMQHKEGSWEVLLRPTAASGCSTLRVTKTFAQPSQRPWFQSTREMLKATPCVKIYP